MPLKVSFPVIENGNTVPYPPLHDEIRANYGFVDLRGRPDLVASIPEATRSAGLNNLLTRLAASDAALMTLGATLANITATIGGWIVGGWREDTFK